MNEQEQFDALLARAKAQPTPDASFAVLISARFESWGLELERLSAASFVLDCIDAAR